MNGMRLTNFSVSGLSTHGIFAFRNSDYESEVSPGDCSWNKDIGGIMSNVQSTSSSHSPVPTRHQRTSD